MIVIGRKQRIATGVSLTGAVANQLGIVKGTLGACKIVARLWGGATAGATMSSPSLRHSWDGVTATPGTVLSIFTATVEGRDLNATTEATGLYYEVQLAAATAAGRGFGYPALALFVTPAVTTLITVDAWVFYEAESDVFLRHAVDINYAPLLPA